MPDPEEIPENTMALPFGNSCADTGNFYFYRNTCWPKLDRKTVH